MKRKKRPAKWQHRGAYSTLSSGRVWCPHEDHHFYLENGVYETLEAAEADHEEGAASSAPRGRAARRKGRLRRAGS